METASCMVRLDGSRDNVVFKTGVTPPEAMLLQFIHGKNGENPLSDFKYEGMDKRPHAEEMARLRERYSLTRGIGNPDEEMQCPFVSVFGKAPNPKLPVSFDEIGVDVGKHATEAELSESLKKK